MSEQFEGTPAANPPAANPWGTPPQPPPYPSPPPGAAGYGPPAYGAPQGYPVAPGHGGPFLPVPPQALASPGQRFGGLLLSVVLMIVTLGIGYFIWALIAWTNSTTPAKQVLGLRVVDARSGAPVTFGQMAMRQVVWTLVLGFASSATAGIVGIVDAFFVFGTGRQRLLDKMANTLVVRSPAGTAPQRM
jgi:uncharacterized RDD family membrane protein YckC